MPAKGESIRRFTGAGESRGSHKVIPFPSCRSSAPVRVTSFVVWIAAEKSTDDPFSRVPGLDQFCHWRSGPAARGSVWAAFAPEPARGISQPPPGPLTLLAGEAADWSGQGGPAMADGASIHLDAHGGIEVTASLLGLPPVFVYQDGYRTVFASSPELLLGLPGIRPELDVEAACDLFRLGHPVQHRTLLRQVKLLPPGQHWRGSADRPGLAITWEEPIAALPNEGKWHFERQVGIFRWAVDRLSRPGSFLSLGGDAASRAILVELAGKGIPMPVATLSGKRLSPAAQNAESFCRQLGVRHASVHLGSDFIRRLPELAIEASRRSGGLAGVEQAPEVYFCEQTRDLGARRLAGNWGIRPTTGRRGADLSLLAPEIAMGVGGAPESFGNRRGCRPDPPAAASALPVYAIGQSFMPQASPYAVRALVEASGGELSGEKGETFARALISRLRDGVPPAVSGPRWPGRSLSLLTEMANTPDDPAHWLRIHLKAFAHDLFTTRAVRDSGVFDKSRLTGLLDDHFLWGGCRRETLVAAFDLALFLHQMADSSSPKALRRAAP